MRVETRAVDLYGDVESLNFAGVGFDAFDDEREVRPSFLHLLPQVLAVGRWAGGTTGLLVANAVVGGLALLCVFCFGARLTGRPGWSLVATLALAVCLPQVHFSRDTFSELPAQLLFFAGLALLWDAVRLRRAAAALVAGLVLGISCVARIDAFVSLPPLVVVATVLALAGMARVGAALVAGTAVGALLGLLDATVGSPAYLSLQWDELRLVLLLLGVTSALCLVVARRPARVLALWDRLRGRVLAGAGAGAVALLALYAAVLRPSLETGRHLSPTQPTAIAVLQEAAGRTVDPLRSYDELSLTWLSWYSGWPAVALGVLGLCALVWRLLRRPATPAQAQSALLALAPVLLLVTTSALYLWRPSIIPVQYWATRRFLPLTLPGLLLCAAWLVAHLPRPTRRVVGPLVALALLVPPLTSLVPRVDEREYRPVRAAVDQLCAVLEEDDAVVLVEGAPVTNQLPHTIRAFCGNPVAVAGSRTTAEELAQVAQAVRAAGKRPVYLTRDTSTRFDLDVEWEQVVEQEVSVVALSLYERPDERYVFPLTVYRAVAP